MLPGFKVASHGAELPWGKEKKLKVGDVECGRELVSVTIQNENLLANLVYLCIVYEF